MPRGWTWAPGRPGRVPPDVKNALSAKAQGLIESVLVRTHVKAPPRKPRFNYIVGFESRWHGGFFYLVAKYASPGPHAISPFFDQPFARLTYDGDGSFRLAYMRHTGQWWEIRSGLDMDEALEIVRQGGLFSP